MSQTTLALCSLSPRKPAKQRYISHTETLAIPANLSGKSPCSPHHTILCTSPTFLSHGNPHKSHSTYLYLPTTPSFHAPFHAHFPHFARTIPLHASLKFIHAPLARFLALGFFHQREEEIKELGRHPSDSKEERPD